MAERLGRLESTFLRHPIYFITACTHQRQQILANAVVHSQWIKFAERGAHHGAWIGDYVLMPDHFHTFVSVDHTRITLSNWIKSLKNSLSAVLRSQQIPSPHWQKGFFDHVLRTADSYSAKWEYVRENPVRAGLVKDATEWQFSGQIFPVEFLQPDR